MKAALILGLFVAVLLYGPYGLLFAPGVVLLGMASIYYRLEVR